MNNENFDLVTNDENEEFTVEFGEVINDGGTHDYNELDNQPQINGHTLEGNKTNEQLGIPVYTEGTGIKLSGNTISADTDVLATKADLNSKQNVIADLPQIRSGAEAGATAVQPEDLARIATTGSYNDSLDKPSINNVALIGNISLDALGIQPKGNYALESEIPDVSNFITNTVDNLVNYYKKSETFTKQEVNDLISAITTMDIRVVQTLPTEDISTTTIYFVPKTTAGTNDVYDEYIYVSNAWEHIGSTDIDLSGYQTKIDSSHKLSSDLVDDTNQTNKFVTENEKTTWNTEIENLQEEVYKAFPTDTASGAVASFTDGADNLPLKSLVVNINPIQDTSQGDPSPENICPISGWTGAQVVRTGKNLFDVPASVTKGYITFTRDSDGYVTANPNNADSRSWGKDNAQFLVNLAPGNYKLVIQLKTPSASQYSGWEIYSPTGVKIAGSSGGKFQADEVAAFTASTYGTYYIMAKIHSSAARFMVVKDGADTSDYEPYTGDTYSITFPAAAGTVYGGTLDVTTGKLTVDRAMVDLGAKNWYSSTAAGRTRFRTSITDIERISSPNVRASLLCSNYPTKTANQTYQGITGVSLQQNEADIYIYDPQTESMTTAEFKSAMSGVQLVYKLATPQTYQLTPTEVTTLLGDNTIWANTGDTTAEYRADTKLYINKMIGDAETISTRLASGGRETALYKGAINPIETNIPLEEEGVEY